MTWIKNEYTRHVLWNLFTFCFFFIICMLMGFGLIAVLLSVLLGTK